MTNQESVCVDQWGGTLLEWVTAGQPSLHYCHTAGSAGWREERGGLDLCGPLLTPVGEPLPAVKSVCNSQSVSSTVHFFFNKHKQYRNYFLPVSHPSTQLRRRGEAKLISAVSEYYFSNCQTKFEKNNTNNCNSPAHPTKHTGQGSHFLPKSLN